VHACGVHLHGAKLATLPAQGGCESPSSGSRPRKSAAKRADPTQRQHAAGAPEDFLYIYLEIRPSGQWKKETASTKNPVNQPGFRRLCLRQSPL